MKNLDGITHGFPRKECYMHSQTMPNHKGNIRPNKYFPFNGMFLHRSDGKCLQRTRSGRRTLSDPKRRVRVQKSQATSQDFSVRCLPTIDIEIEAAYGNIFNVLFIG